MIQAMDSYDRVSEGFKEDELEEELEEGTIETDTAQFNGVEQYEDTKYEEEYDIPFDSDIVPTNKLEVTTGNVDPDMMNKIINKVEVSKQEVSEPDKVISDEMVPPVVDVIPEDHSNGLFISVTKGPDKEPDKEPDKDILSIDTMTPTTITSTAKMDSTHDSTIYDECTIKELKDILTEQDLPTSGNKTKLIQRILSCKK